MKKPNFILFITDQQKASHLGAYGNPILRTPHIDAIAARGWKADCFYVATPICMPNRASLMTGRMPSVHGARLNGIPLAIESRTFVDVMREAGYRTALVGKSHLQNMTGKPPQWPRPEEAITEGEAWRYQPGNYDQEWGPLWRNNPTHDLETPFYGFSRVDLAVDHGDRVWGHYWRWLEREHPDVAEQAGEAHAIPTPDFALSKVHQAWRTRVPEALSTNGYIGSQTCALLAEYAREERPFFIQCSFPDPHHPFTPHGRYWDMYDPDEVDLPASFHESGLHAAPPHVAWLHAQRDRNRAVKHTPALFACTEREAREAIALNYGSISHIDAVVGDVMAALKRHGLDDNTVIIFMSDHGDYLGDHQLLWKGPIHYQSLVRTPFIWMDPGCPQSRHNEDALASTVDVAPTILARAGLVPYNGIQGHNLLDVMAGRQRGVRQHVLIEEEGQRVMFGFDSRVRMRTLFDGRHRLSLYDGIEWGELYDLESDPMELHNLWHSTAHESQKARMLQDLARTMLAHTDTSPNPTALA